MFSMRSVDRMRINLCIETNKPRGWGDNIRLHVVSGDKARGSSNTTRARDIYSPKAPLSNNQSRKELSRGTNAPGRSRNILTDRRSPSRTGEVHADSGDAKDLEEQHNRDKCEIVVVQDGKKRRLFHEVGTAGHLTEFLRQKNQEIVTYVTVPTNLAYDFYLSSGDRDASFFNGRRLTLAPYLRAERKKVDIRSFEIIKCIGAGGFSKVFLAKFREDGRFYAMKLIDKQFILENRKQSIVSNERSVMVGVDHPFVLPLKFAFESAEFIVFVLEYCPGGELFTYVKRQRKMTEDTARFFITETLLGLEHLHEKDIIYRDLKPENIMLDLDGHVRIADFGLAKPGITAGTLAHSFCGSPEYMPPEMILRTGHGRPVDFYCLGALLFELVTGLPPFYSKDTDEIYQAALAEEVTFPRHVELTPECQSLIRGLLHKNCKLRLGSMFGAKEVLAHPWFGRLRRKDVLERRLQPPIRIDDVDSLQFDFGNVKESDYSFLTRVQRQQDSDMQLFRKVMGASFYYDHRGPRPSGHSENREPKPTVLKSSASTLLGQRRSSLDRSSDREKKTQTQKLPRTQLSTRDLTQMAQVAQLANRPPSKQLRKVTRRSSKNVLSPNYTLRL